jgi:serine phosphatase RsbU (regulator of sigma subunit)
VLLSTLVTGWGVLSVSADDCQELRLKLPQLQGKERVAALEQLYYCSMEEDDVDEQLRCLDEYVAEARRQGMNDEEAFALSLRSALFYNNDMNDSIFNAIPRDMQRVKSLGVKQHYFEMWSRIPNTYIFLNQNKLGLRETEAMYEEAKKQNDTFGMGLAYSIMGTAYANLRNFDQSIEVFQKSISLLSTLKPSSSILPETYTYYGNALNEMKDYRRLEALTVDWKKFLDGYVEEHHLEGNPNADVIWAYYNFACVQAALGQNKLTEAEQHLDEASQLIASPESYMGMKWLYYMAQLRLQQNRLTDALNYNNQRMELLTEGSDQSVRVMIMQQRAEILEKQMRYAEAATLYRDIYLLSDSLNAQDTKDQLNEMNTMYQLDEKEMENERLQMQNERNQFRFIIIVVTVIVLSLAIFLFFRIRAARRLKQAHTELQTAYSDLQAANEVIEETTAAKERIESELRIARDIQMSMVPSIFPERADLDLFASMTPAKEVGGDLYNFLPIEGTDKMYFALGDVSGKGVPASLFMAQATRLFRTLAKQQLPPAEIATRMNDELGEDNEQGMFVTMFLGLVDIKTGHLDFCNAGHNPPVLVNESTARFIEMEPNAPIGLWPGLEYVGEELDDIRQQALFIYTDGLNEAENRQQEQFSDERLLEILNDRPFESSQQTIQVLKEEVEKHRDGAEPNDDLTMMCMMIKNNN